MSTRALRRVVVFTADPDLQSSRWWRIVLETPGIGSVLLVRRTVEPGLGSIVRRLRSNVRKHGLLFLPYRAGLVIGSVLGRLVAKRNLDPSPVEMSPVIQDVVESADIHSADVLAQVRSWAPDLGISLGAPILRPPLFSIPPMGTLNLHLGRVPEFRGAPPGFWEVHEGATEIGATVHWITEGLDTGPVIASALAPLYPTDLPEDVDERVHELGQIVLKDALGRVLAGELQAEPQRAVGRTFRMPTLMTRARLALRLNIRAMRHTMGHPRWVVKTTAATLALGLVRPIRDAWRTLTGSHPVRIFTYHRVTELCRDGMTVSPRVFRRQVEYVSRTHRIVSLERALELLESRAALRRPVAVITFDDAYRSVWDQAAPILARAEAPATVFVSTALPGTERRFAHDEGNMVRAFLECMTWEQLAALQTTGWSIGAHTANHVRLSACSGAQLRTELHDPIRVLRERLGLDRVALAYPFGQPADITPEAVAAAQDAGYRACFSDFGGDNRTDGATTFQFRRIDIGGDHATLSWRAQVRGFELGKFRRMRPSGNASPG